MLLPKYYTSIEIKQQYIEDFFSQVWAAIFPATNTLTHADWQKFTDLISDQLIYGAKKYGHSDTKEATDVITERFGMGWWAGTNYKYVQRYQNVQREKDLLKVAAYQYIGYLQMGFHLEITENVELDIALLLLQAEKAEGTDKRLNRVKELLELFMVYPTQNQLVAIVAYMFATWVDAGYADVKVHDTDTWNETDKPSDTRHPEEKSEPHN